MKLYFTLLVLALFLLLVDAKPGGGKKDKKDKKGKKGKGRGHERPGGRHEGPGRGGPDHGRGEPGPDPWDPSGRPDGRDPGRGGHERPSNPGRGGHESPADPGRGGHEGPGNRDPRCDTLSCDKPTRDTYVCGTDGETYRSECHLIREICQDRIASDVEVASHGRCQHPAEAGEPYPGPGRYTPGHKGPGGKTPHGHHHGPGGRTPHGHHHGPGGRTPGGKHPGGRTPGRHHGRYPHWRDWVPRECWDLMPEFPFTTTMAPESSVPDYIPDFEGPACTATCPIGTPENPVQNVCGTNGRDYESACILELVACVTSDMDLAVGHEGRCL
ncbi:uncharacterized protein [Amphiura filiformis]|uniref:uncharacterized protein n=1 Tax=Amphiura filiformis TaxID=82378 RepID=UPI003B225FE3